MGRGSDAVGGLGHVRPHTAILFHVRGVVGALGSTGGTVAGALVISGCFAEKELQGRWMKQGVLKISQVRNQS